MTITPRVLAILLQLRMVYFLTARQLQRWCVPNDKDCSTTRDILRKMESAGYVRRLKAEVHDPLKTPTAPVWVITGEGSMVLASKKGDVSLVLDALPNTRNWPCFRHYVEVAELAHTIEAAFNLQSIVTKGPTYFEHEIISDAKEPEQRYRLYVSENVGGHRIVSNADFAFTVKVGEYCRAYYGELQRGTETPKRVAAKKTPGYGIMQNHFKKHFPDAQDWRVLFVWPNAGLRDAARRAVDPQKAKNWLFAALPDISEAFLHEPVIYSATDGPRPFIKPPVAPQPPR